MSARQVLYGYPGSRFVAGVDRTYLWVTAGKAGRNVGNVGGISWSARDQ